MFTKKIRRQEILILLLAALGTAANGEEEPPPTVRVLPPLRAASADEGEAPPPGSLAEEAANIESQPTAAPRPSGMNPMAPFLIGAGGFGGMGGGMMGGMSPGGMPGISTGYSVASYPDQAVTGQGTDLGLVRQQVNLSAPIWRRESDSVSLTTRVRNENFNTTAILPDSLQAFPQNLWNVQLGLNYSHRFDGGAAAGAMLSGGSTSDQPFHSGREITLSTAAYFRKPSGERNAWMFMLMYSPTSQLVFPIPGVAYFYNPNDYVIANIGIPFQLMVRPMEDLMLDFSYMPVTTVHAGATYRIARPLFLHGGFDWTNEGYFLADRAEYNQRLYYYEMTLSGGLRFLAGRKAVVGLVGGYAFNRFYFEGNSLFNNNNYNRIDVGAGPYLSLHGTYRW